MSEAAPSTRRIPLAVRVLLGVAVGTAIGVAFGTSYTGPLGDIGLLVVRLLKALAAPLIFVCVIDAILRTRIAARAGLTLVVISLVNAAVATGIGLSMGAVMKPEKGALLELVKKKEDASSSTAATTAAPSTPKKADEVDPTLDPLKNLGGYVPENLVDPFRKNAVISIVLLALLVGAALRAVKERGEEQAQRGVQLIEDATHAVLVTFTKLLGWVIEIVPFAVLGVVASVVGKSGIDVFRQLGLFLFTCLAGLSLQALVWYSLLLLVVGRTSPLKFFAGAFDAIVTALSCSSSLATLLDRFHGA